MYWDVWVRKRRELNTFVYGGITNFTQMIEEINFMAIILITFY